MMLLLGLGDLEMLQMQMISKPNLGIKKPVRPVNSIQTTFSSH